MREKGQTEVAKTLETPVFSRGIEILTEKIQFLTVFKVPPEEFKHCSEDQFAEILGGLYNNFEVKVMGPVELPSSTSWETNSEYSSR